MSTVTTVAAVIGLLGSGLIAGVFFAFSNFIMQALARVPSPEGIAAMQSINVVVLNRTFLGAFAGTAAVSVLAAVLALAGGEPSMPYFVAGALLYVVGTFLVTGLGNVPLNSRLADVAADTAEAGEVWSQYLDRWTRLNTLRTIAAFGAALMFTIGLLLSGDG